MFRLFGRIIRASYSKIRVSKVLIFVSISSPDKPSIAIVQCQHFVSDIFLSNGNTWQIIVVR
jgi:hypothetical protein